MRQEGYVFAMEAINKDRWDGIRPLKNFIYVHLHNQFFNLKRKHYHRLATPCEKCPLHAYKADTDTCLAYDSKDDCKWYAAWTQRNESKKSLMHAVEMSPLSHPCIHDTQNLDNADFLNWAESKLPEEFRKTWDMARRGERVNNAHYKEMLEWLRENVEL